MSSIVLLDAETVACIAAGEVVENPASVVKELVENSLDAGSRRIEVSLLQGGIREIVVADDGCGMDREDAAMAFERHATSKIRRLADLQSCLTLGFRGEALASMATVARVELLTRTAQNIEGTKVTAEGGAPRLVSPAGCPVGTSVAVRDLFFNTPARRKHLRGASREGRAVTEILQHLALSAPNVAFSLRQDGKLAFSTPGKGSLEETVRVLYGTEVAAGLKPLELETKTVRVRGLIARPLLHRSSRALQQVFVNGRYVHYPRLSFAIEDAYRGLLPGGRHPVFFLSLTIDPEAVDVNVHPAKIEVRVAGGGEPEKAVGHGVRSLLVGDSRSRPVEDMPEEGPPFAKAGFMPRYSKAAGSTEGNAFLPFYSNDLRPSREESGSARTFAENTEPSPQQVTTVLREAEGDVASTVAEVSLPMLHPLGQFQASFILAQSDSGDLYIIDQHAAHERVLYEDALASALKCPLPAQQLALPITLEISPAEEAVLTQNIFLLSDLGLTLEHFGSHTFLLRSLPIDLSPGMGEDFLRDLLGTLGEGGQTGKHWDAAIRLLSCRRAIKAHQTLSLQEQEALIRSLARCNYPSTCPHGRPTMISLSASRIARRFERSG